MSVTESPDPSRAELVRAITRGVATVSARHRCSVARSFHHSGISLGHMQILWILQEHGPLPVSRLAEWLGIGVPNATGLLDRMEQRGLIARARDTDDRRVVLVRATEVGRDTVARLDGWRDGMVEQVLAPLANDQLALLAAHLDEVAAGIPDTPDAGSATDADGTPEDGVTRP